MLEADTCVAALHLTTRIPHNSKDRGLEVDLGHLSNNISTTWMPHNSMGRGLIWFQVICLPRVFTTRIKH
jgi:hypothetical protein